MTRRRLTPDEIELWHRVTDRTERLHPVSKAPNTPFTKPFPKPFTRPKPATAPLPRIEQFSIGQRAPRQPWTHDLKPVAGAHLSGAPVKMDRKAFGRMKRGKLRPEGRIDLHGLTLDRAHPALVRFILTAQTSGKRLVLVITGKGKPSDQPGPIPVPFGVLKNQVPHWLSIPPCAQVVLEVASAHISHGGAGALYVYLRRGR